MIQQTLINWLSRLKTLKNLTPLRPSSPRILAAHQHQIPPQNISPQALHVIRQLKASGYQAYLVGGCVRDLLLGQHPKDFDIATDALPQEIRKLFPRSYIVGRRFQLVHVRIGSDILEVATFRRGHPTSIRFKQIKYSQPTSTILTPDNVYGSLEDDVWRRDLSINACFLDPDDLSILDYTGGLKDLAEKRIRIIGRPSQRYHQDPVRILRVLRFAAKLNFPIEPATAKAIRPCRHLLEHVPSSRLRLETVKLFYTGCAQSVLRKLQNYGIFDTLFPLTVDCLANNPQAQHFIALACQKMDERFKEDLPLSTGFLFAVLLWAPFQQRLEHALAQLSPPYTQRSAETQQAIFYNQFYKTFQQVTRQQRTRTDLPRYVTDRMTAIWMLQYQFQQVTTKTDRSRILRQPHFKAAYDFLLLRAENQDPRTEKSAKKWNQIYKSNECRKRKVLHRSYKSGKKSQKCSLSPDSSNLLIPTHPSQNTDNSTQHE